MNPTKTVRALNKVAKKLSEATNNRIVPHIPQPNEHTYEINCWGFTARACGWETRHVWLPACIMEEYLSKYTKRISKRDAQVGDIVVYRATDEFNEGFDTEYDLKELIHTALLVHPGKLILHKPGSCPVEVTTMDGEYEGASVSYRRIKQQEPLKTK